MRVHGDRLVLAPVAQDPVDLLQRGLVVLAVPLERNGQVFVGVDVVQRNRAGVIGVDGPGLLEGNRSGKDTKCGQTSTAHRQLKA